MLKDLSKEAQSHLIIVSSALLIILIVSVIIGKGYLVYVSRKNNKNRKNRLQQMEEEAKRSQEHAAPDTIIINIGADFASLSTVDVDGPSIQPIKQFKHLPVKKDGNELNNKKYKLNEIPSLDKSKNNNLNNMPTE